MGPEISATEMNVAAAGSGGSGGGGGGSSSSSSISSSSSVMFAAHTYRGGVGEWIKAHAEELRDKDTQVTCDV